MLLKENNAASPARSTRVGGANPHTCVCVSYLCGTHSSLACRVALGGGGGGPRRRWGTLRHTNMKVQVFLPATIILCAVLVILIKVRQDERGKEEKRALFLEIKVRVSDDVLRDYANEKVVLRQSFNTAKDEYKTTDKGKKETEEAADAVTLEAQKCEADQVRGILESFSWPFYFKDVEVDKKKTLLINLCFSKPPTRVSLPFAEIY